MAFELARLPAFTFVDSRGNASELDLSRCGGDIGARAELLRSRVAAGAPVGLIFRSEPALVLNWLACLAAGVEPLIMQYPTEKQTRVYWEGSVANTLQLAGLKAILVEDKVAARGIEFPCPTIAGSELEAAGKAGRGPAPAIGDYSILQLSSGTTGHRKAVRFRSADLARHADDYNRVMQLNPERDVIVSWLPLYHDMGYIACFVMPMLLGVRVAMMDPMDWVRNPPLLASAIARHRGTVCYMPNFGYEVMSRATFDDRLDSMRLWISCSEPVSAATMAKFRDRIGARPESLVACYAMAENIFAVSQSAGIGTRQIDGHEVVSCGPPIPDVKVKIVDNELWVKSPTSLHAYIGGQDIRDADGFYPTGDLGQLIDGELYVTGRKQDLLIQAGRKFMLSDLDLHANATLPEGRGRFAAVAIDDAATGTQKPLFLLESERFFARDDVAAVSERLKRRTGVDYLEVQFVPPGFITKTSSGKINRKKTAQDWQLVEEFRLARRGAVRSLAQELADEFPGVSWDRPVRNTLDSLAGTVLQLLLDEHGVQFDPDKTLDELVAGARAAGTEQAAACEGLSIVVLGDRRAYETVGDHHLRLLEQRLGCKVEMHHVCAPPSPVLLSDLVFHDYFMPRAHSESYRHFESAVEKIRSASLLIVDDVSEIHFPLRQVYAVLSHRLEREPEADLVGVRWQRYAQGHADLPCGVATGMDFPPQTRSESLASLQAYLGIPVFKIALVRGFSDLTADWDFADRRSADGTSRGLRRVNARRFVEALGDWIEQRGTSVRRVPGIDQNRLTMVGLPHYCSWYMDRGAIEQALQKYQTFCIAGSRSSVPYVEKRLTEMGKRFHRVPSFAPQWLDEAPDFDCLLILGAEGDLDSSKPALSPMSTKGKSVQNIDDPDLESAVFRAAGPMTTAYGLFGIEVDRAPGEAFMRRQTRQILKRRSQARPAHRRGRHSQSAES